MGSYVNEKCLIAIGSSGFIFKGYEDHDYKNEFIVKVIPLTKYTASKDIHEEAHINLLLSTIHVYCHVFDYKTSRMQLASAVVCPIKANDDLFEVNLTEELKRTLNRLCNLKGLPSRIYGDKYYAYEIEYATPFMSLKEVKYVLIGLYQIVELFEGLMAQHDKFKMNFGHHDLHIGNLCYTTKSGKFQVKIIDFGNACVFASEHFKCYKNHKHCGLNQQQHTVKIFIINCYNL